MSEQRPALNHPNRLDGIDVSVVQGRIDWAKVAAAGFRFAVVKVSEGIRYVDPYAPINLQGAAEAGLYTMAYAFACPSQGKPEEHAERLWTGMGPEMPGRVVLDLEAAPSSMPASAVVQFAEAFVRAWESRSALRPVLYTYPSFAAKLQPELSRSELLATCPLWMAQYRSTTVPWAPGPTDAPLVPRPWSSWAMWQYSGNGGFHVPGVTGDCDRNVFNGDGAVFREFCGYPSNATPGTELVQQ